jgi:hypothetical protein
MYQKPFVFLGFCENKSLAVYAIAGRAKVILMQKPHQREKVIALLSMLILTVAFVIALFNRQSVALALQNAIVFAGFVCLLMVFLHIGASIAEGKGYPTWFGVVITFLLNIVGLLILLMLPSKSKSANIG